MLRPHRSRPDRRTRAGRPSVVRSVMVSSSGRREDAAMVASEPRPDRVHSRSRCRYTPSWRLAARYAGELRVLRGGHAREQGLPRDYGRRVVAGPGRCGAERERGDQANQAEHGAEKSSAAGPHDRTVGRPGRTVNRAVIIPARRASQRLSDRNDHRCGHAERSPLRARRTITAASRRTITAASPRENADQRNGARHAGEIASRIAWVTSSSPRFASTTCSRPRSR